MLNPGHVLQVGLVEGWGKEWGWPGQQGAQGGPRAGQVVVVEHQRPSVLGLHLFLLRIHLFSAPQVDLRIV